MKKRQSEVQKFSTFLGFSDARESSIPTQWLVEPELERTIKQQVQEHPGKTAETWALHFLAVLQNQSSSSHSSITAQHFSVREQKIAEKHLSAFLQEVCYQAAQKVQRQFQSVQYKYSLADLFQIGNLLVNQPAKLFHSFKSTHQYSSLEGYAKTALCRFICNTIYAQDLEAKRGKFSDYGLLRDLSHKELKEALASKGINTSQIDAYCFARHCYSAVCQPQTRYSSQSLDAPTQENLVQIASCYNQQHNQLIPLTGLADAATIQAMLSTCIQAARAYRTRQVLTLESDDIVSDSMPTPWESAIQIEEREQVEALVSQLFTAIPEIGQTLLKLWLGLNLTQAEIATVLKHKYPELQKQYQVARQLGKYNRNLLKEFLQQCQQLNPDLVLQDDKELCFTDIARVELIQESLDECLQLYCKRLVYADLEYFTQQYSNEDEFSMLASPIDVEQLEKQASELGFTQAFEDQLEQNLNLPPESLRFVNKKIAGVVSEWLQTVSPRI